MFFNLGESLFVAVKGPDIQRLKLSLRFGNLGTLHQRVAYLLDSVILAKLHRKVRDQFQIDVAQDFLLLVETLVWLIHLEDNLIDVLSTVKLL